MPMSPGPHSAKEMPGTAAMASASGRQCRSSILSPSISSPSGFRGHGSALRVYSVGSIPQIAAGALCPPPPRRPSGRPRSRPIVWKGKRAEDTNALTAAAVRVCV